VAAVSEAGAIGTVAALFTTGADLSAQIERVRALTERPFVVNHVVPSFDEDAFQATLEARPAAVSFALGHPGPLVERVHAAGARVIHQVHTVAQARDAAELGVDVVVAQGSEAGGQGMAAGAGTMALVPQVVDAVAPSNANVLIQGENGTGKELIANALHHRSPRAQGPFIKINCAAIPKDLIESELFGYKKGAFTGASSDKVGLFELAEGGALMLDEIGEMPAYLQTKLLRVLQEREYRPIGGDRFVNILAGSQDLRKAVTQFRVLNNERRKSLAAGCALRLDCDLIT